MNSTVLHIEKAAMSLLLAGNRAGYSILAEASNL
jgi:hypothetical protein